MRTYIAMDGNKYTALNPDDLVMRMHAASHTQAASDEAWMEDVAARAKLQSGAKIDASSPLAFVTSMLEAGLLKEDKETA
jgi:hypothetical protein